MDEKRILVLRHPETEANVTGRWVGRGDAPYTERGREQAVLLAEEIVRFDPDAIFTSPLKRCRSVAEDAADRLGLEARIDARLIELDFGQAEGLTYEETVERGIRFDFKSEDAPVAPGGESRRDIFDRTSRALDDVLGDSSRRSVIVTHGGVFRSTVPALLALPLSSIWAFHIANAAYLEYRVMDGFVMIERFGKLG